MNKKIILYILIYVLVIGFFTTGVVATVSDLSQLKGTGSSKIGESFNLSYTNSLKGNTGLYCIQKDKSFKKETKFILKNYVEINGNEATVYGSANEANPSIVKDVLNGQVAYILNRKQGYGTHEQPTDTQKALWYVSNSWTTKIFGNNIYSWEGNASAIRTSLNDRAEEYAEAVGDDKAPTTTGTNNTTPTTLSVQDKTNKDTISIMNVDEYYRIGPFRWEFDGILNDIKVTGNNGIISNENIRFVKYSGTSASVVEVSNILSGEAFYIDVKQGTGINKITKMELKTISSLEEESGDFKIYTAKIWFFHSSDAQNVIYVDVGEGNPESSEGNGSSNYEITFGLNIGIVKVDDRDERIPLSNVGFKFKAKVNRYIIVGSHQEWIDEDKDPQGIKEKEITVYDWDWRWVERYLGSDLKWSQESSDTAQIFYTDNTGNINIKEKSGEDIKENSLKAIEVSNPYYGYDVGKEYAINSLVEKTKLTNHQTRVKLSGYVWLDEQSDKMTVRNDEYDSTSEHKEKGINGITVYLRDINGNEIGRTTTSELDLYSEIDGGEYQFVDVNLDELQAGHYYVEFEYCGIEYQSVAKILDKDNGSKAIDTNARNVLDAKFESVDSTGSQSLEVNGVTLNYNEINNNASTISGHITDDVYNYTRDISSHSGCNVFARTDEAEYNLYSGFKPVSEEIRYVNLGLFKKVQTDYALTQDLYNVKVDVNGFSHIYKYGKVRFNEDGSINEDSSWNMGVKFQNNRGTYNRAIYTADAEYEAPNHKDNEIKVYVTYKLALRNESTYIGKINSIVDYCDNRCNLVAAGTSINDNTSEITGGDINYSQKSEYNDNYSKYIIDVNMGLDKGETKYVYLQFKIEREGILTILNNGDLINNVAEINSYTTFKEDNKTLAVIDFDSVPGNMVPGTINTYEDDTDAARSLQLELRNARALQGTVFVDSTGKDDKVYTNEERKGNGIFDNGETTIEGTEVKLCEIGKDDSSYEGERVEMTTTTDENGNFEFVGYIPGNYIVTYTWGDQTYKVQYYKGTIYDENRKKDNPYWYKGSEYNQDTISVDTRKTDAMDSSSIREKIDNEMEALKYNTLEDEINKAYDGRGSDKITVTKMDSSTPTMSFSVEYETTVTDGTIDQVRFTVKNVDFGIVERPKQQLEFSKRISGFKITLANGQILVDAEITEDGQLKGTHKNTTYLGPTSNSGIDTNGIIRSEMDTEIMEGATLEITYVMKVTNVGELDYISDRYYYYGNKDGSNVVKASVTGLIDYVDGRLSVLDDKWTEVDSTYLDEVNARQKDNEEYLNSNRTYLTDKLSKELAPNESNTVTLHTSKLLTSTDDNTFDNQSEITEVTKNNGFNTGTPVKVQWNEDQFYYNFDNSETAIIIPSTGEDRSYAMPTIIGISTVLVLGVGIFVIKKFVIDNK